MKTKCADAIITKVRSRYVKDLLEFADMLLDLIKRCMISKIIIVTTRKKDVTSWLNTTAIPMESVIMKPERVTFFTLKSTNESSVKRRYRESTAVLPVNTYSTGRVIAVDATMIFDSPTGACVFFNTTYTARGLSTGVTAK